MGLRVHCPLRPAREPAAEGVGADEADDGEPGADGEVVLERDLDAVPGKDEELRQQSNGIADGDVGEAFQEGVGAGLHGDSLFAGRGVGMGRIPMRHVGRLGPAATFGNEKVNGDT